jgi:hypothetical protein
MANILDQLAQNALREQFGSFQPKTTEDFFALRLATRLNDSGATRHYAQLADQYSESQLLLAYHRAIASGGNMSFARRFHEQLEALGEKHGLYPQKNRLIAIRIERRTIAIAILNANHLDFTDVRHLSSSPDKALGSAASFVTRAVDRFALKSAALEHIPNGDEVQRLLLHQVTTQALAERAMSVTETPKKDLFLAFSHPPLRSRTELRQVMSTIWPVLDHDSGRPFTQDAAALGLYVQTERLFNT